MSWHGAVEKAHRLPPIGDRRAAVAAGGEIDAAPRRVVVHNPADTTVFERLTQVDAAELEERFLFRHVPDRRAFGREHTVLVTMLRDAGVEVLRLSDVVRPDDAPLLAQNPNHVYCRDPAITVPWLPGWFIRGAMRKPIRRNEPHVMASALRAIGLRELFAMPHGQFLEGGDVIPLACDGRRTLLVGFGPRSDRASLTELCERLMPWALDELIGIELVRERMNLDGALVPVSDDTVLVEPTSILRSIVLDQQGERPVDIVGLLSELGMEAVEVTRREATTMQACNCVCLGKRRVISYDLCERVTRALRVRDINVQTIPGSELIKGTGGPRCMTRPLYA